MYLIWKIPENYLFQVNNDTIYNLRFENIKANHFSLSIELFPSSTFFLFTIFWICTLQHSSGGFRFIQLVPTGVQYSLEFKYKYDLFIIWKSLNWTLSSLLDNELTENHFYKQIYSITVSKCCHNSSALFSGFNKQIIWETSFRHMIFKTFFFYWISTEISFSYSQAKILLNDNWNNKNLSLQK